MPEHVDLGTFRTRHFDYKPGHHTAFFGPTQLVGKTTTAYQLLQSVIDMYPEIQPVTLCMKHQDKVIAHWSKALGFRETPSWPPQPKFSELPPFGTKPPGYTLWPPQTLVNPVADNERLSREFIRAITWNRGHTPSLTHANELYGLLAELNLPKLKLHMRELLTAIITRDSGAGHGLWYETQKPSGTQGVSVPGFFFNSAEHMFLGRDGEERNRRRYAEIACGISPDSIEREVLKLEPYSWLYLRRSGPEWAVIDAYDERLKV